MGELIAAAKAKPGELKFVATAVGTGTHLGIEKFNLEAGIRAAHVPAQPGDAIAGGIADAVAERTTYIMAPVQLAVVDIRAGNLRAPGVTTKRHSSLVPDVPTIAEVVFQASTTRFGMECGCLLAPWRRRRENSERHRAHLGYAGCARRTGEAWG